MMDYDGEVSGDGNSYIGGKRTGFMVDSQIGFEEFTDVLHERTGSDRSAWDLEVKAVALVGQQEVLTPYDVLDKSGLEMLFYLFERDDRKVPRIWVSKHPKGGGRNNVDLEEELRLHPTEETVRMSERRENSLGFTTCSGRPPGSGESPHGDECLGDADTCVRLDMTADPFIVNVDPGDPVLALEMESGDTTGGRAETDDEYAESTDIDANMEGDAGAYCNSSCDEPTEAGNDEHLTGPITSGLADVRELGERIFLGARFATMGALKDALVDMAVTKHVMFEATAHKPKVFAARCTDRNCKWRIRATVKGDVAVVVKFEVIHDCGVVVCGRDHKLASYRWVARKCRGLFKESDLVTAGQIQGYIRKVWGIDVHYQKAHRAKDVLLEEINGNYEESYSMLPSYAVEYERANAGSKVAVVRH